MDFFGEDKGDLLCEAGRLEDDFYIETMRIEIRSLVRIIRGTYSMIKIEERIVKIGREDKEMNILNNFMEIGSIIGGILLSKIGEIGRFE